MYHCNVCFYFVGEASDGAGSIGSHGYMAHTDDRGRDAVPLFKVAANYRPINPCFLIWTAVLWEL